MKSKELKHHNLPINRKVLNSVNAKPYILFAVVIIIGVILLFFDLPIAYGITLMMISLSMLMFMPKRTLADFYDEYMVLYNRTNNSDCVMIYYDEIVSWSYKKGISVDEFSIELINETIERIDAFSKISFEVPMSMYAPGKERKR